MCFRQLTAGFNEEKSSDYLLYKAIYIIYPKVTTGWLVHGEIVQLEQALDMLTWPSVERKKTLILI